MYGAVVPVSSFSCLSDVHVRTTLTSLDAAESFRLSRLQDSLSLALAGRGWRTDLRLSSCYERCKRLDDVSTFYCDLAAYMRTDRPRMTARAIT